MGLDLNINQKYIDDYNYQNAEINKILITRKHAGKPFYIDIEEEMIEQLAHQVLNTKDDFIRYLGETIKNTLDWSNSKNIYQFHYDSISSWDKDQKPPFIALLVLFSYAAEMMGSDEDFNPNNYYQRLMELMDGNNDQRELLKKNSKNIELFWLEFNKWLELKQYEFGIPTARSILKKTKYISYPISQSLIRDAERRCFRKLFELKNWSIYKNIEKGLYGVVNHWMTTNNPNKWLKTLWNYEENTDFLQETIMNSIKEEFNSWKKTKKQTESGEIISNNEGLKWKLEIYNDFGAEDIELFMISDLNFPQDTLEFNLTNDMSELSKKHNIYLKKNHADEFELTAREDINLDALFNIDIELNYDETLKFTHIAKPLIILADIGNNIYVETDSIDILRKYCFICTSAENKKLEKFFHENGITAKKISSSILENNNITGDWHIYSEIFFPSIPKRNLPLELKYSFNQLDENDFSFVGGLLLRRDTWHSNYPPNIIRSDGEMSQPISIKKYASEICLEHENGQIINYDSEIFDNSSLELICNETNRKNRVKYIHLRSANNPHPKDYQRKIGYTTESPTSARDIRQGQEVIVTGNYINVFNKITDNSDLNKYLEYKYNLAITEDMTSSSDHKKTYSNDAVQFRSICMKKGYHYQIVPAGDKLEKNPDKSDFITCKYCDYKIPYIKKKTSKIIENADNSSSGIKPLRIKHHQNNISTDHLFDAICYTGSGSFDHIDKISKYLLDKPLDGYLFRENLINLGHIDVIRNSNGRISYWNTSQPTLNIKDNLIYLSGFRSVKLTNEINNIFLAKFNLNMQIEKQALAPERISWSQLAKNQVDDLLEEITGIEYLDQISKKFLVSRGESGLIMLQHFDKFINYIDQFEKIDAIETDNFEKFNFENLNWVSSKITDIGAYKPKDSSGIYYFFDGLELRRMDYTSALNVSLVLSNLIGHEYDINKQEFKCLKKIDIPGIYKRILIAETGLLPSDDGKNIIYGGITKELGLLMMEKLYG